MSTRSSRVLVVVAALVAVVVGVAWAHATLVRSEPAADAHVTVPPTTIRLEFNEAVLARTSRVDLVAPDSQRLALAVHNDSTNARLLVADVPTLTPRGHYRVEWRLVGPDGHAMAGQYSFSIDSAAVADMAASQQATPPVSSPMSTAPPNAALSTSLRFLSTLATTILFGATAFMVLVLPRVRSSRTSVGTYSTIVEARGRALAFMSTALLVPVLVLRLLSQEVVLSGSVHAMRRADVWTIVESTSPGRAWAVFVIAAVVALVMLRRRGRRTDRTPWLGVAAACIAMAAAAPFLGHPAAADSAGAAMALDAIHILAAGGWAGSIMIIGLVALPVTLRSQVDDRVLMIKSLLSSFTPVALACAGLLAITGTGEALLQLGRVPALWQTPYGLALIRKLVLVGGVTLLGAWHWRVAQATLARSRAITALRWSIVLDVVVVIGVIALTAALTGTPPPTH